MEAPLNSCLPPHDKYNFCNALLPEPARLDDLLSRLSLQELVGQLFMNANLAYGNTSITNSSRGDLSSTGISRLGIAQFNYMGQGSIYRGASNGCALIFVPLLLLQLLLLRRHIERPPMLSTRYRPFDIQTWTCIWVVVVLTLRPPSP